MTDLLKDVRHAASKAKSQAPTTFDIHLPKALPKWIAADYQARAEYARWATSLNSAFLLGTGIGYVTERNPQLAIIAGLGKGGLEAVRYDYQAAKNRIAQAGETGIVSIHNPVRELLELASKTPNELLKEGNKYLSEVVGTPMSKAFNIAVNNINYTDEGVLIKGQT